MKYFKWFIKDHETPKRGLGPESLAYFTMKNIIKLRTTFFMKYTLYTNLIYTPWKSFIFVEVIIITITEIEQKL